jgi:outer membrane protein assembly factor BamB
MEKYRSTFRIVVLFIFTIVLSVLAACGGGSDGGSESSSGSSSVSYTGLTTQAILTSTNAPNFFSIMWGSGSYAGVSSSEGSSSGEFSGSDWSFSGGSSDYTYSHVVSSTSVQSLDSKKTSTSSSKNRSMANILVRLKDRSVKDYSAYAVRSSLRTINSMVSVNQTYTGSISGTLTISGNIDSITGTGSLAMSYVNFNDGDGFTYDGNLTVRVDGFDVVNSLITDGTANFTSWKIQSGTINYELSGTMRIQESALSNISTQTYNLDGQEKISNTKFRFENFVEIITYDNILNPTSKTEAYSGRLYVDNYGYVNVSTASPLVYSSALQQNPGSGGPILLSGAGSSKASLAPYSTSYVEIDVDADGDNVYESRHVYSWSDMTGAPVSVTPIASAGPDQTVTATTLVTLDGTGSVDLNGNALTYAWTITSKPNGSSAVISNASSVAPSFTADIAGSYVISLVVNNGTYASNPDTVTVTAIFNVTQPSPTPPLSQSVAYQMDYAHSGRVVFSGSISFPGSPTWSVTLNGSISYPLIAGGRVYVTTTNPGGSGYGSSLYALDKQTGNIVWGPIYIQGYSPRSGLAYDNGKVFVIDPNGLLKAFNAATGDLLWSSQMPYQYDFSSPPTAVNGIVYVGGAGSGGTLYAVDAANGNILWTASVEGGAQSSPAVSSDGIFVTYPCQAYKFDPLTGAALWHYSGGCSGGGGRTPAYANGRLYMRDWTNPLGLIFNSSTGGMVGNFTATPIPAFTTSTGYFLDSGTLKGIDLSSNAVLWSFVGDGTLVSAPIIINDIVVVGSSSGNVYALDANTSVQKWSGSTGSPIAAPDEHNASEPLTGLGAGEGYLVVPAGNVLTGWHISGP